MIARLHQIDIILWLKLCSMSHIILSTTYFIKRPVSVAAEQSCLCDMKVFRLPIDSFHLDSLLYESCSVLIMGRLCLVCLCLYFMQEFHVTLSFHYWMHMICVCLSAWRYAQWLTLWIIYNLFILFGTIPYQLATMWNVKFDTRPFKKRSLKN